MISKTKIDKKMKNKTSPVLAETIMAAKKKEKWLEVAALISMPRRKMQGVNIDRISKEAKEGETIVIAGKVLSKGELGKKLKICALGFSALALKKIKESKGQAVMLLNEIKSNPDAKGVKLIK